MHSASDDFLGTKTSVTHFNNELIAGHHLRSASAVMAELTYNKCMM
jgi:hypothetical protein